MGALRSLLLPRTDAGVAAQAVIAVIVLASLWRLARHDRDLRFLVSAMTVMTVALFGLRAAH